MPTKPSIHTFAKHEVGCSHKIKPFCIINEKERHKRCTVGLSASLTRCAASETNVTENVARSTTCKQICPPCTRKKSAPSPTWKSAAVVFVGDSGLTSTGTAGVATGLECNAVKNEGSVLFFTFLHVGPTGCKQCGNAREVVYIHRIYSIYVDMYSLA